jgi:agmatinase (EC 3.5.3.11)
VPLDIGTSLRSGTRFGPRQIRAESVMIRPYNMATGAAPFDSLSVADIGDVAINTFNLLTPCASSKKPTTRSSSTMSSR